MGSSISSAANFNLPRQIPGGVKFRILLGNPLTLMGLFFAVFGGVMAFTVTGVLQTQEASSAPRWIALFPLMFPLAGIIMLLISMRVNKKYLHLVQNGILTAGKVTGMEATNMKINNRTVYKVFFEFAVSGGMQKAVVKTHNTARVRDEKEEKLVYDPNNPESAALLDAMPKAVRKFFEKLETGF